MDYNQYQTMYEERPTRAADFRRIARKSLKGFWWMAALVTLIAAILGGVVVGGASFNLGAGSAGGYTPDMDTGEYEESLTPEEEEMLEQEIPLFDLDSAEDFFLCLRLSFPLSLLPLLLLLCLHWHSAFLFLLPLR